MVLLEISESIVVMHCYNIQKETSYGTIQRMTQGCLGKLFVGCKERPMTQDLHVVCSFAVHCIMMYLVNGKMGVCGWGKKTLKYYQSAHGL